MAYRLQAFSSVGLDQALLALAIDEHERAELPRLHKPYHQAQLAEQIQGMLG